MRDLLIIFLVAYFYSTAILVVIGIFSRTLMGTEDEEKQTTYGLWQLCLKPKDNPAKAQCSLFDWQNEVKDTVAADRVRSIQAFGTMTFIGAVVILTSPFLFPIFLRGYVSFKLMSYVFLAVFAFMGVMGSITWLLLDTYFDDVMVDDFSWVKYGWGAYVFMVGVSMTSMCVPVIAFCVFCQDNAVHPAQPLLD